MEMAMDLQNSVEDDFQEQTSSESIPLHTDNAIPLSKDTCHDHFRIDKEQSMFADCQRLVDTDELLDKADKYGITLLHIAAAKSYVSVVRFLLQHHVNVDQSDDTGATALHLCAKHEQGLIVKLLLDARANPTICDRFGRRPSEVCSLKSSIRSVLLKAESRFVQKRQRAEQSDDSLEEEHLDTVDSLSDAEDDSHDLFMPIPERPVNIHTSTLDDNLSAMLEIFDEKSYELRTTRRAENRFSDRPKDHVQRLYLTEGE